MTSKPPSPRLYRRGTLRGIHRDVDWSPVSVSPAFRRPWALRELRRDRRQPAVLPLLIGLSCVFSALAGCDTRDLPDELVWESQHFRYHARKDDVGACPAVGPLLEQHLQLISAALPTLDVSGVVVDYHKFSTLADFEANSRCAGTACAPGAAVETTSTFDTHELVHAYVARLGEPPWLLVEGLAVALGCQRYPKPPGRWVDHFNADPNGPRKLDLYAAGGWLVGHLLREFGHATLVELYRKVPRSASADDLSRKFSELFGRSLDAVWSDAVAGQQPMFCPWHCREPASPIGELRLEGICSVGEGDARIDVSVEAPLAWRLGGKGRFFLRSCSGEEDPVPAFSPTVTPLLINVLRPGRYFLDYTVDSAPPLTLNIDVDGGTAVSDQCQRATPLSEPSGRVTAFLSSSEATRFLRPWMEGAARSRGDRSPTWASSSAPSAEIRARAPSPRWGPPSKARDIS